MLSSGSEQSRTESSLRESEARFRALLDQANDAIFLLLDGYFIDCNAKAQEMYGRTREQILGRMPDAFAPPVQPDGRDTQEKGMAIFHSVLAGEPQFFEWLSCLPDGTPLYTEVSLNRLELAGKIYIQAIVRDITERKRAEENKVRSLALLQATLDSTADGILTIGLNRQILSYNETFVKMWGIPDDVLAANNDDRAVEFVVNQLRSPDQFLAKVRYLYDHPLEESFDMLNFKDGQVFERFSRPMLVDGKPLGRVWSFRDVSARQRAEEQIAEQAALLDEARDAIIVRNIEGKILFWNKGAERVYGWTRQEVLGRNVVDVLHTSQKRFDVVNALTITQGEWHGELHHLTKAGRKLVIEVCCSLIRNSEGRPKSILSINTDITERKKIEAQFMRAQRMESVGTLAGGIAHDLNNILAPIMMSIEVLRLKATDPQSKHILDTIAGNSMRGADIVRQLLSFARGLEGDCIEVEPGDLIKNTASIVKNTFPKDIRLELSLPGDSWNLLGDLTQLHQVLLNLCLNARDAMPRGGILGIKVENTILDRLFVEKQPEAKVGRYVIISVSDSGTGIPSEIVDKIFEPFFTTKELGKGTGLGLSMVLAIVKSHGGFVNVVSNPDLGTTFKIYLPAMDASAEARKESAALPSLPHGCGETILVVDDEPSVLIVTSETLTAFGYNVLTACDGAEAVAIYLEHRDEISAVLTDMAMPIMDGAATVHALRKINPAVKVIVASGSTSGGGLADHPDLKIEHFLAKPYTAGTLLKTLRTVLVEGVT
jgi:PAS domain S-box-containing protein